MENSSYGNPAPTSIPYSPMPPRKAPYDMSSADIVMGVFLLIMGMFFWEWRLLAVPYGSNLGTFLFIAICLTGCLIYMHIKGIRQNPRSLTALGAVVLSALPFLLYDTTPLHFMLLPFLFASCLIWIAYSGDPGMSIPLSGFIISDAFNQIFVIPFCNFGGIFSGWKWGAKQGKSWKSLLAIIIGMLAFIPIFAIIINLLISADQGFSSIMTELFKAINAQVVFRYILHLALGIPVACYIFGSLYGNGRKRGAEYITKEKADKALTSCHKIPGPGVYGPLALLIVIYITFFAAMGTYLFSGLAGKLPDEFTYAEYARQGFFELCGVAFINLIIVALIWLFTKRESGGKPLPLRIMSCAISLLTLLLIITAASKMILYIDQYGLTRLRLYTLCIMAIFFALFLILSLWHIKPFNAGRAMVIACVILILAPCLSNTDGFIAKYNIDGFESGKLKELDTYELEEMSDAVIPPLADYISRNQAKLSDSDNGDAHSDLIFDIEYLLTDLSENFRDVSDPDIGFYEWNIQSAKAKTRLNETLVMMDMDALPVFK